MASYNLNEVLKKKKKGGSETNGEVKLDDVSRVKVLSPTMQVFKRFIRNRLAVFGSVVIIVLPAAACGSSSKHLFLSYSS